MDHCSLAHFEFKISHSPASFPLNPNSILFLFSPSCGLIFLPYLAYPPYLILLRFPPSSFCPFPSLLSPALRLPLFTFPTLHLPLPFPFSPLPFTFLLHLPHPPSSPCHFPPSPLPWWIEEGEPWRAPVFVSQGACRGQSLYRRAPIGQRF